MPEVVEKIMHILDKYHDGETASAVEDTKRAIAEYIEDDLPIQFVLPAFAAKSPNELSVSGYLPDAGEEIAIKNLREMLRGVQDLYPQGADLHIVSDGHFFIGTGCTRSSEEIDAYVQVMKEMTANDRIRIYTINDFYTEGSLDEKRHRFEEDYRIRGEGSQVRIASEKKEKYKAKIAFVFNEFSAILYPGASRTQRQKKSRRVAREFIACERAVGQLVKNRFPNAVRLSIHRQNDETSAKYYFNLMFGVEGKGMPWLHVVKTENGGLRLAKRVEPKAG